ncbi:MAG: hypothetical protein LBL07_00590 [Tannerella sp.]|jgi:sensor histidine kinase YesM|nr:hypothetical protein [Tannerella sp.]
MGYMLFPGEKIIKSMTGINKKDEDSDIYDSIIGFAILALTIGCFIGCFYSFVNSVLFFAGGFSFLSIAIQIKDWIKGNEKFLNVIYSSAGLGYFYCLISCFLGLFSSFWVNLKVLGIATLIFIGICFIVGLFGNSND